MALEFPHHWKLPSKAASRPTWQCPSYECNRLYIRCWAERLFRELYRHLSVPQSCLYTHLKEENKSCRLTRCLKIAKKSRYTKLRAKQFEWSQFSNKTIIWWEMPKLKKWDILDDFQTMCLTKIEFAQLSKFQSSNHHIHGSSWTSTSQFDQLFESMSSFATFQVPLQNSHRLKNNSQLESCEWSKKIRKHLTYWGNCPSVRVL